MGETVDKQSAPTKVANRKDAESSSVQKAPALPQRDSKVMKLVVIGIVLTAFLLAAEKLFELFRSYVTSEQVVTFLISFSITTTVGFFLVVMPIFYSSCETQVAAAASTSDETVADEGNTSLNGRNAIATDEKVPRKRQKSTTRTTETSKPNTRSRVAKKIAQI